jgi:hypothetical protein
VPGQQVGQLGPATLNADFLVREQAHSGSEVAELDVAHDVEDPVVGQNAHDRVDQPVSPPPVVQISQRDVVDPSRPAP